MIALGYEVGSGRPIAVPLRHMVITGQTQEAGKTTALEAMIERSGLRAVAFITKRGEGSFQAARRIEPYFREQADWQFVASILEASRGERLRFERAWIIRASKGARTLADVQANVRRAMDTAKGLSADVYLTLDAYLDAVVPCIERVRWASTLALAPGVNAMDLTGLAVEMQHLVVKSVLDWVLARETQTVVIVPEAWKFIPQGRGTPVKLAAESFIRQAAGLRNYLWLDSQDIAGVDKTILKSVAVWLLGVQRESNEVKRTLAQIPAGIKRPRPEAIATLGLGQFFACWGSTVVRTYAQPPWMSTEDAQAIARGERSIDTVVPPTRIGGDDEAEEETAVTKAEARRLQDENDRLRTRVAELERERRPVPTPSPTRELRDRKAPAAHATETSGMDDGLYHALKRRLLAELPSDPTVLRLATERPELLVHVARPILDVSGETLPGRLARLIAEGFFDEPRSGSAAYQELKRRGVPTAKPNVYREADKLALRGFLTKEPEGYRAVPGMKVNIVER